MPLPARRRREPEPSREMPAGGDPRAGPKADGLLIPATDSPNARWWDRRSVLQEVLTLLLPSSPTAYLTKRADART